MMEDEIARLAVYWIYSFASSSRRCAPPAIIQPSQYIRGSTLPQAGPLLWTSPERALGGWHALRNLVIGANRRASECVLGHFWSCGGFTPTLHVVRQTSRQHGWPVLLLQSLSALNAASVWYA